MTLTPHQWTVAFAAALTTHALGAALLPQALSRRQNAPPPPQPVLVSLVTTSTSPPTPVAPPPAQARPTPPVARQPRPRRRCPRLLWTPWTWPSYRASTAKLPTTG